MQNSVESTRSATADLGRALIKAFGLPGTTSKLTIRLEGSNAPIIETEHYPEDNAMQAAEKAIAPMKGRFELRPVNESID